MKKIFLNISSRIFMVLQNQFPKIFFLYLFANEIIVRVIHKKRLGHPRSFEKVMPDSKGLPLTLRSLSQKDFSLLDDLLNNRLSERSQSLFTPHARDPKTLRRVLSWNSFFPCGLFVKDTLAGYIILRIFAPRKATMATLVCDDFQGQGLGSILNRERLALTRSLGLQPYSSVTKTNEASIKATLKSGGRITCEIGNVAVFTYDE